MKIRTELLVDASRLVESVMSELDTADDLCSACGRHAARNWEHRKAYGELAGTCRRLRRLAETLDGAKSVEGDRDEDEATG